MDWGAIFTEHLNKLIPAAGVIFIIYYISKNDVLGILHQARDQKVKFYTIAILIITLVNIYISTLASGHEIDPIAKLSFHGVILIGGFLISHAMFEQWREVVHAAKTWKTSKSKSSTIGLIVKETLEAVITTIIGFCVDYFNFFIVAKDNGTLKESNDFLFSLVNPYFWGTLENKVEAVPTIMIFLVGITAFTFLFIFLLALAAWDEKLKEDIYTVEKKEKVRVPATHEVVGFFFQGLHRCRTKAKVLFDYNINKTLLKDYLEFDYANKVIGINLYINAQKHYDTANVKEVDDLSQLDPVKFNESMQEYYGKMQEFSDNIQKFWDLKKANGEEVVLVYPEQSANQGQYNKKSK